MWSCGWVHVGISFVITGCSLLFYLVFARKRGVTKEEIVSIQAQESAMLDEDIPTEAEKKKMDKEYKIWRVAVGVLTVLVILLYVVSFIIK